MLILLANRCVLIQVASRALEVPIDIIHLSETCTNTVPNAPLTGASSGSDINGMAVMVSALELILLMHVPVGSTKLFWLAWTPERYEWQTLYEDGFEHDIHQLSNSSRRIVQHRCFCSFAVVSGLKISVIFRGCRDFHIYTDCLSRCNDQLNTHAARSHWTP